MKIRKRWYFSKKLVREIEELEYFSTRYKESMARNDYHCAKSTDQVLELNKKLNIALEEKEELRKSLVKTNLLAEYNEKFYYKEGDVVYLNSDIYLETPFTVKSIYIDDKKEEVLILLEYFDIFEHGIKNFTTIPDVLTLAVRDRLIL